jgi:TolA-binding protein
MERWEEPSRPFCGTKKNATFVDKLMENRSKMNRKWIFPVICLTVSMMGQAQQLPEYASDRLLREGRAMLMDGNYAGCREKVAEYKKAVSPANRMEEADFLLTSVAFHQGQADAETVAREFLDDYPETAYRNEIYLMIGSAAFARHDYPMAGYWLAQCRPERLSEAMQGDYAYRRGMIYLAEDKLVDARRMFDQLEKYSAKYGQASLYYKAYVAYKEGDYERALGQFVQIRNHATFGQDVSYYIAQIYFAQGNDTQAIRESAALLEKDPNHPYAPEIERISGVSHYRQNRYGDAIRYLQPLADRDTLPQGWEARDFEVLGVSYYQVEDYRNAVRYLSLSDPGNDGEGQSVYLYLGQSYLQLDDRQSALRAFESASRIDEDALGKEAATYNYAMLLHQTAAAGFGESVTALEDFVRTYPQSIYSDRVNDALVDVYLNTKNYDTALSSIARIGNPGAKILEARQKIYYYLGTVDLANGKYTDAIQWFTQAIEAGDYAVSEKRQAMYWRGESYYRQQDYRQAGSDYRSFLSGGPGGEMDRTAYYNLGYCAFKQEDYQQAETMFKTYVARERADVGVLADAYARLGDCYFHHRRFTEAGEAYDRAVATFPATGDYALFQKANVLGLQKDYRTKIAQMERLERDYPQSPYLPDGLYEKGRGYVLVNEFSSAIETFRQLLEKYADSPWARNAGLQLGLLYYNSNRLPEAAAAYREVVARYPGSEEARAAVQDLKSVYFDQNDLEGYVDYVRSLGDQLLEAETLRYSEEAVGRKAETFYNNRQYADALQSYRQLQTIATGKTNHTIGSLGLLRSAVQLKQYETVIEASNALLSDETLNPEWVVEARYARAKAFLAQGDRQSAEADLEALAADTRTAPGAEARYLLAQYYFDTGHPEEAKIVIQDYIQQGTPHAYWLARSFILLADIYTMEGDLLQARQYLESLRNNYKNKSDDIHTAIQERLKQ